MVLISPGSKINWSNQSPPSPPSLEPYRLNQPAALGIRLYTGFLHFQPFLWVIYSRIFRYMKGFLYASDRVPLSVGHGSFIRRTGFLYTKDRILSSVGQGSFIRRTGFVYLKDRVLSSVGQGSLIRRTGFLYPSDRVSLYKGQDSFIRRTGFLYP